MDKEIQRFEIQWKGFVIEIRYCPHWLESPAENHSYALAHLEVETIQPAKAPLPITETGYRSHFDSTGNMDAAGGPIAFVLAWLDQAAESPAWKKEQTKRQQYSLF